MSQQRAAISLNRDLSHKDCTLIRDYIAETCAYIVSVRTADEWAEYDPTIYLHTSSAQLFDFDDLLDIGARIRDMESKLLLNNNI